MKHKKIFPSLSKKARKLLITLNYGTSALDCIITNLYYNSTQMPKEYLGVTLGVVFLALIPVSILDPKSENYSLLRVFLLYLGLFFTAILISIVYSCWIGLPLYILSQLLCLVTINIMRPV